MKLAFHPDVRAELRHLAVWYEERREGLGADVRDEVWRALGVITEQPNRWPLSTLPKARALGVRHFAILRFHLAIEYTTDGETVHVFTIAHMRRRPGYWLRRLGPAAKQKPRRR